MAKPPGLRSAPARGAAAVRLFLALAVLGLFLYAWLSPGLASNELLAPLARTQFSASLYGAGAAGLAVIVILALTLLCGRVYCSVLCPLGTLQELVWRMGSFLRGKIRGKKGGKSPPPGALRSALPPSTGGSAPRNAPRLFRGGYTAPPKIRYLVPLITGAAAALAFSPLMMLFDPISSFGRGMNEIRVLGAGGAALFTIAIALPLAAILIAALFRGRAFCNWCPVGLTLGLFSSAAPFGMKLSSRCVSCGICEKKCPAGCVNAKEKRIDGGRCVLCLSCASACPAGCAGYGFVYGARGAEKPVTESRRVFLKGAGKVSLLCGAAYLLGPSVKLFARAADGGNGGVSTGGVYTGGVSTRLPVLPPGAVDSGHYGGRCVGCLACASSCPVGVIKTISSSRPELDYTEAGCQFNCVECGKICPTGAIRRLDEEEKHRTRVALSALFFERCVVNTRHESCGACAEVCPTGAVTMTGYGESGVPFLTRPVFDEQYCIGCGVCYAACPAVPKAFTITAVSRQTLTAGARPVEEEPGGELQILNTDDFPF
jgi:formate hydrogenlyase subunit 6/NADH:ubiquinone oxidoreductase subunit I